VPRRLSALAHKFGDVLLGCHFLLLVPSGDTGNHSVGITYVIVFTFRCTEGPDGGVLYNRRINLPVRPVAACARNGGSALQVTRGDK
jgi:hypothetical protein